MIDTEKALEIKIKDNYRVILPNFFIESGITHLNNFQANLLLYLFSVFSSTTNKEETTERTQYCYTNNFFSDYFGLNKDTLPVRFKKCEECFTNLKYTIDFENWLPIFDNVKLDCCNLYVEVNKDFKTRYLQGLSDSQKPIFATLELLTQLTQYEQKIYLMCRIFKSGGARFKDKDMTKFLYQVGLYESKTAHIYNKLISRYIKPACEHISSISELSLIPKFATKTDTESKTNFVSFVVNKNKKAIVYSNNDAWNNI